MVFLHQLEAKFTSEGNKDVERNELEILRRQLLSGDITPFQAINAGSQIDNSRIER